MTPRIAFQFIFAVPIVLLTASMLSLFAVLIQPVLAVRYTLWVELAMVTGQVLFQWLWLARECWERRMEYMLLVLNVSWLGACMLCPIVGYHFFHPVPFPTALIYFFGVVGIMFLMHWHAVKKQGFPGHLCLTWVLYRCLLLLVLVKW